MRDGAKLKQARDLRAAMTDAERRVWSFVRDPAKGLPASTLIADSAWHPLLRARAEALVGRLASEFGLKVADNLGQRLSKKMLAARPLMEFLDLATDPEQSFRTSTVHKVKGESLDAVLYVAKKPHVRAFLDGPASEDGRIGYGVPEFVPNLCVLCSRFCSAGFRGKWPSIPQET